MKNISEVYKALYKIALIIGVVVTIMLMGGNIWYEDIKNLYLLPLCYTVSMLFVRNYFINNKVGIAVTIIEVTKFVRFILQPLVYIISDQIVGYVGVDLRNDYHEKAVLLMCYEMLAVSLVMFFYYKFHYNNKRKDFDANPDIIFKPKQMVLIFSFIWLILVSLIGQFREILLNFSLNEQSVGNQADNFSNNTLSIIFNFGKIYIYVILLYFAYGLRNTFAKVLMVVFASIVFISSCWNDGGMSISRWGLIVSSLLVLYAFCCFFPYKKKTILASGTVLIFAIIALGTYAKMAMVWDYGQMDVNEAAGSVFASEMFDLYFQGVYSVSNGLSAVDSYAGRVGFQNFLTELFYHFPFAVSLLGLQGHTWAEYYFKLAVGDMSKICPSLIQSYFYFGPLGCPLFSCFSVYLALVFTDKLVKERDFTVRLLYVYGIFWLSLYNCINFTIVEAHIWFTIIGIWICRLGRTKERNVEHSNSDHLLNKGLV